MKTINSRVNRVTKIAPDKVTKKDVPRLVSLAAQTSSTQKPKFYIGDFVRVVKKYIAFRKSYKQSFTDKVFEITVIPTLSPTTYSLIDADKELIQGKVYQPELQLVRLPVVEISNNRFEDEFTVHVVSSASMEIFDLNTLPSFRKFFNDEIQLAGDWRVALSEFILPTKIENTVNRNLIVYNLKDYEDYQKMSSRANVISRPYSGQQFSFVPGTFDTVAQLLATIKRTIGLPHFSLRELTSSGKYEILFCKYEGIIFPSEEIPSIIGFMGIPNGNGIHIGYKMIPNANRFMKSDDTKTYYGEFPADL